MNHRLTPVERNILKRVGLFGGTFNPVHFGHLRTALEVKEGFGLDRVHFIPAANPPHKDKKELAEDSHRFAMLSLALGDAPGFSASDVELRRPGLSYTIDTVNRLIRDWPDSTQCYLIVGDDAFMEIDTWKDYARIFESIPIIVMSRPGGGASPGNLRFPRIGEFLGKKVASGYVYDKEKTAFSHEALLPVYPFAVTPLDISATRIRYLARRGGSIRYLVPDAVAAYIEDKRLYA